MRSSPIPVLQAMAANSFCESYIKNICPNGYGQQSFDGIPKNKFKESVQQRIGDGGCVSNYNKCVREIVNAKSTQLLIGPNINNHHKSNDIQKRKNNDIQQIAYIAAYEDVVASRDSHKRLLNIHPVRKNDDFRYYSK